MFKKNTINEATLHHILNLTKKDIFRNKNIASQYFGPLRASSSISSRKSNFLSQQQSLGAAIRAARHREFLLSQNTNVDEGERERERASENAHSAGKQNFIVAHTREGRLKVCIFWKIADTQRGVGRGE